MRFLYDLVLWLYHFLLLLFSPFNHRAHVFINDRKGTFDHLVRDFSSNRTPVIWIHVASLGEYEQAVPIIKRIDETWPDYQVMLTFFSPSGYSVVKRKIQPARIYYLPFDNYQNARRFLDIVKPTLSIFIKYDLWYHYLVQLKERKIPTLLVSARFRTDQFYFKKHGIFFKRAFEAFDHFFVQDETSKRLVQSIGFANTTVSGDTRFDRVVDIVKKSKRSSSGRTFKDRSSAITIVLGSIWTSDLGILSEFIDAFRDQVRFILAPHLINKQSLSAFDDLQFKRYTQSEAGVIEEGREHVLLDTMGMLSEVYSQADIAIVGGASRGALHNVSEPAAYGIPVFFEHHISNSKFREVGGLIQTGGGFEYKDLSQLDHQITYLINDENLRKTIGQKSRKFVLDNAGATEKVMRKIQDLIPANSQRV